MAKPRFRGVLLCEDVEHERFFRNRLLKKWFGPGKLHVQRIPNRQGAGDAFVLARYAREVRLARSMRNENYALIVAIDGDRAKVQGRMRQLEQQIADAGLDRRGLNELIVICVPTRSIETWELWLCGDREVDEERNYKERFLNAQRRGKASAKTAATAWFKSLSSEEQALEQKTLPSLSAGRAEVQRLEHHRG